MEGIWILERVPKNPPAYGAWNGQKAVVGTGEALLGPGPAGMGSAPAYNRRPREMAGSREGVGGGRSSDDGRDNTTRPSEGPLLHRCTTKLGGTLMSAENRLDPSDRPMAWTPFEPFNACFIAAPTWTGPRVPRPLRQAHPQ